MSKEFLGKTDSITGWNPPVPRVSQCWLYDKCTCRHFKNTRLHSRLKNQTLQVVPRHQHFLKLPAGLVCITVESYRLVRIPMKWPKVYKCLEGLRGKTNRHLKESPGQTESRAGYRMSMNLSTPFCK